MQYGRGLGPCVKNLLIPFRMPLLLMLSDVSACVRDPRPLKPYTHVLLCYAAVLHHPTQILTQPASIYASRFKLDAEKPMLKRAVLRGLRPLHSLCFPFISPPSVRLSEG